MKNKPSVAIPNDLKLINQKTILNVFIEGKKYTINDITETTGISNQTVQKGIQHFVNQNLLVSAGKGEPGHSGGRRPEYFMLSTDLYFLCITMWPQYINCSLFNMQGDILFCSERHFAVMLDFQAEVNAVRDGIERMYSGCNIDKKKIKGASFSVPGTVDQRNNIFRYTSPAPPEWGTDIDLIHYFYDMFSDDIVFLIENVAKMTARTVLLDPELRKKTVFVLFTSWGFPGCFLQRGEIFRGENSLSGEFGHMIVNPQDEEVCNCGNRGCFERQLSKARIESIILDGLKKHPGSMLSEFVKNAEWGVSSPDYISNEFYMTSVFDCSERGDLLAQEISTYAAKLCAILLKNIAVSLEPEVVVFQGPYGKSDAVFRDTLHEELLKFRFFGGCIPFEILYDPHPVSEMNAVGAFLGLRSKYFDQGHLYGQ